MGQTRVDTAAVRAAAQRFDAAADVLDGGLLNQLRFDGNTAGRAHTAYGDAVHSALGRLALAMVQWSRAAQEVAAAVRVTADRYGDVELQAAGR